MVKIKRTDSETSAKAAARKNMIKKENKFFKAVKITCILSVAFVLAGCVSFNLYLSSLPPIENLNGFKPNIVTKFHAHDGEIIKTFTAYTYSRVEMKDVPQDFINALIATEDKNFYKHHGYDIYGLARSTVQNLLARKLVQGASTITQQLARILFLSNEKTFDRKLKELVIAARIEKTISKDQILEMYMNNVYLGSGAYGVEGAAEIYFNKRLKQLTLPELALIAGLPQAPSVYSPFNNLDLAIQRRNQVLLRMYKMKFITKEQYEKAKEAKVKLSTMPRYYTTNKAPYFCDLVLAELEKLGFDETDISQGGYKVVTTLDYNAQKAANEAIIKNMNAYGLKGKNQQAAVFSFSPVDGRILAYAGGKDYTQSQYDRVQAIRPAGSAFKPFVYAAAIEKGINPNDLIEDAPVTLGGWSPHNYGNKYRGKIPLHKALMVSSNVCAARLIKEVGIRSVIQIVRVLGITTPLEYDYTIALGSNGTKLYEITRAYGAFANGGYIVEPYAIESVETSRGKVVYRAPQVRKSHQLSYNTAAVMTAMLKNVIKGGTGAAANIGKPAAGKTGTTDDYKDASFIGYTPNVVTGVWVGNDDNTINTKSVQGGTVPALIWRDIMKVATAPYKNADFDYPEVQLLDVKPKAAPKPEEEEVQEQTETPPETQPQENDKEKESKPAKTPADIIKNFKQNQEEKAKQQQEQAPVPPAAQQTPSQQPIQQVQTAPVPIPMAVPESLH